MGIPGADLNHKYRGPCLPPATYVVSGSGPTFVVEWLFDQAQMTLFNVDMTGRVITEGQWNYMHSTGQQMKMTVQHAL